MKINGNIQVSAVQLLENLSVALAHANTAAPIAAYLSRQANDPAVDTELRNAVKLVQNRADMMASQAGPLIALLQSIAAGEVVQSAWPA